MLKRFFTLTACFVLAACSSDDPAPAGSGGTGAPTTGGSSANTSGATHAGGSDDANGGSGLNGGSHDGGSSNGGSPNGGKPSAGSPSGGSPNAGAPTGGAPASTYWKPQAGLTWQRQLSDDVGTPLDVDVYDIDWQANKATVDKLHTAGITVICYVSVGSWEDFRPDAKDFPANVIGNDYDGWPGEKYVDIRSETVRAIMSARFDTCKAKGFDAIEPDNMDVFELGSESGFPFTEQDGIDYAKWLASAAHSRGMGIGQKNASSITSDIAATYDWALTESCYSDGNWCGDVKAYASANKPVFMCEYEAKTFDAACTAWKPKNFSPILKSLDLDAPVTFCP